MNKAQLVDAIACEMGGSRAAATRALDAVIITIRRNVKKGIVIADFGAFTVVKRKARTSTHPQTGKPIRIKASKTVKFKIGKGFKNGLLP